MTEPTLEIARAWGWTPDQIEPLAGGLINQTYVVRASGAPIAVLQRLHPVFGPAVNLDIEAVATHVATHGMETPMLIRTLDGQAWLEHDGAVWRALTWVDGETVHRVPDPAWAEAAGALVGRFHRAVRDLKHTYFFSRAGVHDTAGHLAKLRAHVAAGADVEASQLGAEILAVPLPSLPPQAPRHVHGDLKISNLLFRTRPIRGVALVDLDTLGIGTMAFELGDALRSWCNPHGEDAGDVQFDLPIYAAAIAGFRSEADDLVTRDEKIAIVVGLETVCLELAARFAVDVFEDRYFGWDPSRFPSRRAHNLVRARGQLALARQVAAVREEAFDLVLAGS
jgi:Ser/Thr protein kinase RdoA (MazF antagonist)